MQLFIDIDGVLLNFERTFVDYLNRHCGMTLPPHYEAESWDFEEVLEAERLHRHWLDFLESEAAGHMPPLVPPAAFNRLAERHTVHLVTNFPKPHMPKREANLHRHGFVFHSLDYCGLYAFKDLQPRSKAEVIHDLRRDGAPALFVDDHPDNCLDVHRNCPGVEVWVMSRRFNRSFAHKGIRRAEDWTCLFERLGEGSAALRTAGSAAGAPHSIEPLGRHLSHDGGRREDVAAAARHLERPGEPSES